jgi:hypothetical protein
MMKQKDELDFGITQRRARRSYQRRQVQRCSDEDNAEEIDDNQM